MAALTDAPPIDALRRYLREARQARRLTQAEVARACFVNEATYASWERELTGRPPRLDNVIALADFFKDGIDTMLGRAKDRNRTLEERGISWHLDWGCSTDDREMGAAIWQQLVHGKRIADLAMDLNRAPTFLERLVQNLVLEERLIIESVPRNQSLETALDQYFREPSGRRLLRNVWVGQLGHIDWNIAMVRYVLLGHLAKVHLMREALDARAIGLCGGYGVSSMVQAIHRGECPVGLKVRSIATTPVFEAAGTSANANVSALAFRHADYGVQASELPFVFDQVRDDDASPPAQVARQILGEAGDVDIVYMGIGSRATGALAQNIPDYRRIYLGIAGVNISEIKAQEQPIGNILYYAVGTDGEPLPDFKKLNEQLVCSIKLEGLRRLVAAGKQVVVTAGGKEKADVTRAAIRSGYVNVLIVDDELARAMLPPDFPIPEPKNPAPNVLRRSPPEPPTRHARPARVQS